MKTLINDNELAAPYLEMKLSSVDLIELQPDKKEITVCNIKNDMKKLGWKL